MSSVFNILNIPIIVDIDAISVEGDIGINSGTILMYTDELGWQVANASITLSLVLAQIGALKKVIPVTTQMSTDPIPIPILKISDIEYQIPLMIQGGDFTYYRDIHFTHTFSSDTITMNTDFTLNEDSEYFITIY